MNTKWMSKYLLLTACVFSLFFREAQAEITFAEGFSSIAKKAIPAVVFIQGEKQATPLSPFDGRLSSPFFRDDFFEHFFGRPQTLEPRVVTSSGSGFIISEDGYILTNNHLVQDQQKLTVKLSDGREFVAKVIGQDPGTDLAVLRIEAKGLPTLTLADSDTLEVGQWVVAIGNPLGFQESLTVGVVSAKGRNNLDIANFEDFIQTDASINRGNSGGPLLNVEGNVVGVNTAIVSMGGYTGISFAIPSNMAKHVMHALINQGKVTRGYLGVVLQPLDSSLVKAFELKNHEGALVAEVLPDTPAAKAHLLSGDIILEYNNSKVSSVASLRNAIAMMKPGDKVNLKIKRDNKLVTIVATIEQLPEGQTLSQSSKEWGIEVQEMSEEMARKLNVQSLEGVVVTKVDPNSVAAFAGVKPGAIILSVNRKAVNSVAEFHQEVERTPKEGPLLLYIRQGKNTRYLSLGK